MIHVNMEILWSSPVFTLIKIINELFGKGETWLGTVVVLLTFNKRRHFVTLRFFLDGLEEKAGVFASSRLEVSFGKIWIRVRFHIDDCFV